MTHRREETAHEVVLAPAGTPAASVIWLHGLGADGYDFLAVVPELKLPAEPAVRFVFPHAPIRPVTINSGLRMRAWYDIVSLSAAGAPDEAGIRASAASLERWIVREVELGIPAQRILIAGFSQGGAIALHGALRYPQRLAGVLALSTYLPLHTHLAAEAAPANRDVPILMCHGRDDPVLPMALGTMSRDFLRGLGYTVKWKDYRMQHQVCLEEIADIAAWLRERLTAKPGD
jgi:phospholipase/carboxylesterase